jgi:hypothetical protein
VILHLSSKHETLSSIPTTAKKQKILYNIKHFIQMKPDDKLASLLTTHVFHIILFLISLVLLKHIIDYFFQNLKIVNFLIPFMSNHIFSNGMLALLKIDF